jgi:hypothetical protein
MYLLWFCRYNFNAIIEKALPGLNVSSLRHVIEAVSLQAAASKTPSCEASDDLRETMIALSAHSARTSDAHYAGDQFQLAGVPGFHVDKYAAL